MKVRYSYLREQFANPDEILELIKELVLTGDFTLGKPVVEFEKAFARLIGRTHGIGVGSGTDALMLPLKAVGVGHGDEVITAANTFVATVAAINAVGARPVLVDINTNYVIDAAKIEQAITPRTRAIMPVHFAGEPPDMPAVMEIAERHGLPVVEDSCQAIGAEVDGRAAGTFGATGGFSLHPLKNLNVWGDAGVIVTDSDELAEKLRLLRNYGLKSRDEIEILGYNSRLDSLQAVVGNALIGQVPEITRKRIENAARYDAAFGELEGDVQLPPARPGVKRVYHLYMMLVRDRDALLDNLISNGVSAKVHYPIPLHLQKGMAHMGYERGDFPESERQAESLISLPVDQHLSEDQIGYAINEVRSFYRRG